ncbi:MAG TPA: hypothetical protein VFJ85_10940 [Acidimicrobiales bacterium]|nr:hypothetical protein [Acidimicrobiales bacterium]
MEALAGILSEEGLTVEGLLYRLMKDEVPRLHSDDGTRRRITNRRPDPEGDRPVS